MESLRAREALRFFPADSKVADGSRARGLRSSRGGRASLDWTADWRLFRTYSSRLLFARSFTNWRTLSGVGCEVEGQQVGVGQAQGRDSPELSHQGVVLVAGIAEVVHPVEVVVGGVVDAVVAVEAQTDHGHAR